MNIGMAIRQLFDKAGHASFTGGVHPPEHKDRTKGMPIKPFPFAPLLHLPLNQHIGKPAIPVVFEGQEVVRGQLIAKPDGFLSVALHAPASGIIERIGLMPSLNGDMVEGIYLSPFPGSTQEIKAGEPCELTNATPTQIIKAIQQAGIVGLGGAAFPTHAKLQIPEGKQINTLILNGTECEPYLTNDHRVMLEQTDDIFMGAQYLLKASGAENAIIGVEANKLDAAQHLEAQLSKQDEEMRRRLKVQVVATKYPQGAEKTLIKALLNLEVPEGGLPLDLHLLSVNVATAAEIGRLLPKGHGILERVVTISGPAVAKPGNYRIPIGTPLRFALEQVDVSEQLHQVFLGGPMMGHALPTLDMPITKGTSGFLAYSDLLKHTAQQQPCIRCARCVDVCPMSLNPSHMGLLAMHRQYQTMAEQFHLMTCFECGSCAYVCPSHIPLVQLFRTAKSSLKRQRVE